MLNRGSNVLGVVRHWQWTESPAGKILIELGRDEILCCPQSFENLAYPFHEA